MRISENCSAISPFICPSQSQKSSSSTCRTLSFIRFPSMYLTPFSSHNLLKNVLASLTGPDKTQDGGIGVETHISSIPFTSADATSWILSAGNGTLFTKYGTLYVSDHGLNLKKNIANGIAVDTIKEYFESKGFTLDELASSSSERVKWNLMYLGDWAKYERKYIGPKSFKIRRLF